MAIFAPALAFVLPHEGGYANNPADKGGATNHGITQATLDAWNETHEGYPESVADLGEDDAGAIYEEQYWPGLELVASQAVASKILDMRVNFGVSGGNKIAQQAANTLVDPPTAVDGNWGPDTVLTINTAPEKDMLQALADALTERYKAIAAKDPTQATFLGGWLRRAADIPGIVAGGIGLVALLGIGAAIWLVARGRK